MAVRPKKCPLLLPPLATLVEVYLKGFSCCQYKRTDLRLIGRHVKCDGRRPTCSRCQRLKTRCSWPGLAIRDTLRGRHGFKFVKGQPWIDIGKAKLQFIDESSDLANYYGHYPAPTISHQEQNLPRPRSSSPSSSSFCTDSPSETGTGTREGSPKVSPPNLLTAPEKVPEESSHKNVMKTLIPDHIIAKDGIWISPDQSGAWPSANFQEASLMRYFVEELSQWFDSCDQERHFGLVAPYRASRCPALLYGILSVSARHLSRRQIIDDQSYLSANDTHFTIGHEAALEYQSKCISYLMSLSGDMTEVQDENLLAAAVVLRFYEELDEPLVESDDETYLRGCNIFLNAQANTAVQGRGLQSAAFWVGIRQKVRMAFIQQREIHFDLRCFQGSIYKTLTPTEDSTWANRIVLHCAEVLDYCYSSGGLNRIIFEELLEFSQGWIAEKPNSFLPMYYRAPEFPETEVFPQVWHLDDCHVIALQHWHLAQILLTAFNPRIPRIGPSYKRAVTDAELEIKKNVFTLCGIAMSNKTAPGSITACTGISMCGDRITNRIEQEALLGVLIKTEELQALSTKTAQLQLRKAWNWALS